MRDSLALKHKILDAMPAGSIPAGWSGRWFVEKIQIKTRLLTAHDGRAVMVQPGAYTFLKVLTDETLYHNPPGEVVMEDSLPELRTHLGFAMRASGRVLVTGLGLGCVVRGLLANPAVERVTVIEKSGDVLKLVAPHMPADRLEIIQADALEWTAKNRERYDCAWHDLFTDRSAGEPALDVWHARLMVNCRDTVPFQGAWSFDRAMKRLMTRHGLRWIG